MSYLFCGNFILQAVTPERSLLLTKSKTVAVSLMDDALKPSKIINIRPGLDAYFSLT